MAIKLDKMVTFFEGLLSIKLHVVFITWSCGYYNKLKPLYHQHHSAYGHKFWEHVDLS